jgi:hypothetical protein
MFLCIIFLRKVTDSLLTEKVPAAQVFQPVIFAVVFGNHLQAGRVAVHGVVLMGEVEGHLLIDYWR